MGANNHAYHLPDQDPWATRSDNPNDKFIDSLDATSALYLARRAAAAQEEIQAADQFSKDEKTFRAMYPAYADSNHNMKAMKHHWETVLGVTIPTLEQIEDTFFSLRASGVLELNAKAVAKENEEEILRRAAEIREKREAMAFDEADAYTMPFEELER